jgi:phenylpropionate dioxygenase-like ring-hydroxylating dioxygenase large terminal subunit
VPDTAVERHGLVFVCQEGDDASALDDIPALIAEDQKLLWTTRRDTEANWKIVLEGIHRGLSHQADAPGELSIRTGSTT